MITFWEKGFGDRAVRVKYSNRMLLILLEPKLSLTSHLLSWIIRLEITQRISDNMTADERLECLDPPDCLGKDSVKTLSKKKRQNDLHYK